ncbi:MAG: hypothetical protein JNL28_04980 [Planctomycetes bacterium]|nr:hypothetical protein [Planctomycetota bacterium]
MPDAESRLNSPQALWAAALLACLLAVVWIATLPANFTYGWDESMHVALPAAQMRVALGEGEFRLAFDALLGCAQYPFVQPVLLAFVQSLFGASESVARAFGIVEWCATILGLFVLTRIALASLDPERRPKAAWLAPWIAFALAALSPLALEFGGTLFLEIPSACISVWTLVAWLWLWRAPSRGRALLAGALVTTALFTKWNYGLLLGAGLALDLAWRLGEREGRAHRLRLFVPLALPVVLACVWWFFAPLPGGSAVAADHRAAFAAFLAGNQEFTRVEGLTRVFHATCRLSITPRVALLVLVGAVLALVYWRATPVRALIFVAVATWVPVWMHPFFLERFLIPGALFVWVLAAIGIASRLAVGWKGPLVFLALLSAAWLPLRGATALPFDTSLVGEATGVITGKDALRSYIVGEIDRRRSLGAERALSTSGLETSVAAALLDAIAMEVGPEERCGWIGVMQPEFSPAVLHLGLLARGGSRARFLRDASTPIDLDYFGDPHADAATVKAFAERFDVILGTEPPDAKGKPNRMWATAARAGLVADGAWTAREIGRFELARPLRDPLVVTLIACRPKK